MCGWQSIKLPRQFAALSRLERVLFALMVCAAIAINGWLLNRNLQRMWEAERSPVSRISQEQVDLFPDFIISVWPRSVQAQRPILCVEERVFIHNSSIYDQKPCNMQTFSIFGYHVFMIKPLRQFRPQDTVFFSFINIFYGNISSAEIFVCAMDPSQRDHYLYSSWSPFDACRVLAAGDSKDYRFALDASATRFTNKSVVVDFRLSEVFSGGNHSIVSFYNAQMNPSVSWNTLTVDYQLVDVATSSASFLSVTMVIFALIFPSYTAQYRFRFRPLVDGRCACQQQFDHDVESGAGVRADALLTQHLTMNSSASDHER